MGQRCRHRTRQRRELAMGRARIEPDQHFGAPTHPSQLALQDVGGIAVPAIGGDDHDRSAQRVPVRRSQQRTDAATDERATVTIAHLGVGSLQRHFGRAVREHRGQPSQRSREREDLGDESAPGVAPPPASGADR